MEMTKTHALHVLEYQRGMAELAQIEEKLDASIAEKKKIETELVNNISGMSDRIAKHREQLQAQTKLERDALDRQKLDQAEKASASNTLASTLANKERGLNIAQAAAEKAKITYEEKAKECDNLKAVLQGKIRTLSVSLDQARV